MRIELCIDFEVSDIDILLRASRALGMPLDALIRTAVASFITRTLSPQPPKVEEGEKK